MKKTGVLILFLFLIAGCSDTPKEIERGLALRSALLQGNGCSFDAIITADYGDAMQRFAVSCQAAQNGEFTFTVTEPESISGITGVITDSEGSLIFDDEALQFDKMAEGRVTPVSAPWVFLKALQSGYLKAAGMEEEMLRLTIFDGYEEDALQLDIWLDRDDRPVRAEILHEGRRILALDVENFVVL